MLIVHKYHLHYILNLVKTSFIFSIMTGFFNIKKCIQMVVKSLGEYLLLGWKVFIYLQRS